MIKIQAEFPIHKSWEEMIKTFIEHKNIEDYEDNLHLKLYYTENTSVARLIDEKGKIFIGEESFRILDKIGSMKVAIYKVFSQYFRKDLPWGTLTGIRPVSYLDFNIKKYGEARAFELFRHSYSVREDKIALAESILSVENRIIDENLEHYLVYVHIPFCPTRCNYCSFAVMTMDKFGKWMNQYIEALVKEIELTFDIVKDKKPVAIYIGGGTPSTMNLEQTDYLLTTLHEKFPEANEITFEAGRPETITKELVELLYKNKVTRISINPQSMKQDTLDKIGRAHKVEDIYQAFSVVKDYDIDINTDMILGLNGETMEDVTYTLDSLIRLEPDNITIHSLALKSGSKIKNENINFVYKDAFHRGQLYEALYQKQYRPYYLYRQKRQIGEAENVGFSKKNHENVFNVLSMSDRVDVLAFGMGAVTKFVDRDGNCSRVFGFRDIIYYLEHFDELLTRKREAYAISRNQQDVL